MAGITRRQLLVRTGWELNVIGQLLWRCDHKGSVVTGLINIEHAAPPIAECGLVTGAGGFAVFGAVAVFAHIVKRPGFRILPGAHILETAIPFSQNRIGARGL